MKDANLILKNSF